MLSVPKHRSQLVVGLPFAGAVRHRVVNLPLQSLAVRSQPSAEAPSGHGSGCEPDFIRLAPTTHRRSCSHGVFGIFRVCTHTGSDALVCRLDFDLSPLDVVLVVFPLQASPASIETGNTPLLVFIPPSEPYERPALSAVPPFRGFTTSGLLS
jgi:hypothetical protein